MNAKLVALEVWLKDKWGRFVTSVGAILTAAGTAVAGLPDSASTWLPHVITLTSARVGSGVVLVGLWVASFMRHHKAAQTVTTLQQTTLPK